MPSDMNEKRAWSQRKTDPFESSVRLLWGFVGAAAVAAIGKTFEGSRDSDIWYYALLVVLILTSYGQNLSRPHTTVSFLVCSSTSSSCPKVRNFRSIPPANGGWN